MDAPDDDCRRMLADLRIMAEAAFGMERCDQLFNEIAASDWRKMISSPLTWQTRLQSVIEGVIGGSPEVDPVAMLALLPQLPGIQERTEADTRIREAATFERYPAAASLVEYILELSHQLGPEKLLPVLSSPGPFSVGSVILGGAPGLGRLATAGEDSPEDVTFEERTGTIAAQIAHDAECLYRPLLSAALAITQRAEPGTPKPPPELGRLIARCRSLWQRGRPDLLALLDDRIRVIRNSEAHRNTILDVISETVTFVNFHPARGREELGPLNAEGFSAFVREFYGLCLGIQTALSSAERRLNGSRWQSSGADW